MGESTRPRHKLDGGPLLGQTVDLKELHWATLGLIRRWTQEGSRVERTAWGEILRTDAYPLVHWANMGWVDRVPDEGLGAVLEDLDVAFQGAPARHRYLIFTDPTAAHEGQQALVAAGFTPRVEVALARVGPPSCIVNKDLEFREVRDASSEEDFCRITTTIHAEEGYAEEASRQVLSHDRERARALGERSYVGYLGRTPVATVGLWPQGRYGLVGNVATLPAFRMKGVGRTMIHEVLNAAIRAKVEWALLTAERETWVPTMYQTLGFHPVGELWQFLRV